MSALVSDKGFNDLVQQNLRISRRFHPCLVGSGMLSKNDESPFGDPPLTARQGRSNQRYDSDGTRLCAGTIPIRFKKEFAESLEGAEVLLVSSRAGKGYGLPKGGWEDDETVEEAATRETVEEAGVRGFLEEPYFGVFHFKSGKPGTQQGSCSAFMFVMRVAEELDVWPEGDERKRKWCGVVDAWREARHDWMRDALDAWIRQSGWSRPAIDVHLTPSSTYNGGAMVLH